MTWSINDLEMLLKVGRIKGYVVHNRKNGKKYSAKSPKNIPRNKYGNKKATIDNIVFDSKKEAGRYLELRALGLVGQITGLELQKEFVFEVEGTKVASYFADFVYKRDGIIVVEDVKSKATRKLSTYRLKKKLMKAIYDIDIKES
jgi:hypothetical protein